MAQFEPQPWQDEAKSYMDRHDWAGAIPILERDIVEHPSDPWSRMFLGNCYLEVKQFHRALEHFRAAEALAPDLSNTSWLPRRRILRHRRLGSRRRVLSAGVGDESGRRTRHQKLELVEF
jgi:tetratricopeptide (TPR) repeat protein